MKAQIKTYIEFWGHERRRSVHRHPKPSELLDARGSSWFPVYVIDQIETHVRSIDHINIPDGACAFVFYDRITDNAECEDVQCKEIHQIISRPSHISKVHLINPEYHTVSSLRNDMSDSAQRALHGMLHEWSTDSCAKVGEVFIPLYALVDHVSVEV